ncbi:YnfA family protein [Helicobacter cappadocius]|uniref:YnfA family protein n=1 Tax=Helicobacter cappadocius TaxID=3063998 RepID=A0AA90PH74_9HELI|nr:MULTISPECIES: YnfA family protein [unclassified Helicobacter]MDO7252410.1 YnfA family protein [Helicobacter sp. faydin-H75]MDP2538277.1 YnfA family protein [Helicobacter sp. faydin-H76]
MLILKSLFIFILACVFEVGGGYLIWLCIKENKPLWVGILGAIALIIYGILATLQVQSFGRVYAAYGGIFIAFSLLWAFFLDGFKPDKYDIIGAFIAIIGASIMMYAPRNLN